MKNVLIVSHADGDGHVIAEQVRRNLAPVPTFEIATLIDPVRTRGHQIWMNLCQLPELERPDIVLFVDLMFAPKSFHEEAAALVDFAIQRPHKQFIVLDHHPLPLGQLQRAPNVRTVYQRDVVDCAFGIRSELMVIAALLEKQPTRVRGTCRDHNLLVRGIQRAAALGGPLPGAKLSALLRFECWGELAELGREEASFHPLPRGRRPSGAPRSEWMNRLDMLATDLLRSDGKERFAERSPALSYDLDLLSGETQPTPDIPSSHTTDLAPLTALLELAAICLTLHPESSFTEDELLAQVHELAGESFPIDASDIKIVLGKFGLLKKVAGGRLRLK